MSLNIDEIKQTTNNLLNGIEDEINKGLTFVELKEKQLPIYKKILIDSLNSEDKDEVFNHISWLLYAGGVQNFNLIQTVEKLNYVIKLLNNLPVREQEDIKQKIEKFEKERKSRQLGGLLRTEKYRKYKVAIQSRYKNEKNRFSRKDEAAEIYSKDYDIMFSTIRNYLKNL